MHFTFSVRKYVPFIGQYFGCCKCVARRGTPTLPVQDISLLFGINVAGGKVIMDPIVSEEASYEENELENRVVFPTCVVTLATKMPLAEEETLLQGGIIETSDVELKDTFFTDVNEHFLHSDGNMSRYSIDEEQHSFLDADGDCEIHLDTVQDQRSMRDGPFLKQTIRYVGIELLTRERLISEQKEELALPCSKLLSVEAAEKAHVCYFMKDETLMRKWRPPDVSA